MIELTEMFSRYFAIFLELLWHFSTIFWDSSSKGIEHVTSSLDLDVS